MHQQHSNTVISNQGEGKEPGNDRRQYPPAPAVLPPHGARQLLAVLRLWSLVSVCVGRAVHKPMHHVPWWVFARRLRAQMGPREVW